MHKFITALLALLIATSAYAKDNATPEAAPTPASPPSYKVQMFDKERDFQKALATFIKFDKKLRRKPEAYTAAAADIVFPVLYVEPRYKLFGDLEAPFWMVPTDAREKMVLTDARMLDKILELTFQLNLPNKPDAPFVLEFYHMTETVLSYLPATSIGNVHSDMTIVPYDQGSGFKKEYTASGILRISMPLAAIAENSKPRNSRLRNYLK